MTETPLSQSFGPFGGRVWMNCAHQGPLPQQAQAAAAEAVGLKANPASLDDAFFAEVPQRLRATIARIVGGRSEEIALTNSTSYGFDLLAHGLPWRAGDEILCVNGDFPATVVPWLPLERRGVRVRLLEVPGARVDADVLARAIGDRTRAVCLSWVFSFFGHAVDLVSLGTVCRERGVLFFVNGSQGVGARPLDVGEVPVDAVTCCGFKWLCGPYATGFIWLSRRVLDRLDLQRPHWLRLQLKAAASSVDLTRRLVYELPEEHDADAYDVYCNANFLNFMPWQASLEHLLELGIARIAAHDQALVGRLINGLSNRYRITSPHEEPARSTLVLLTHEDPDRNLRVAQELAAAGVDVAVRDGRIRLSPHLYNSEADVDAALAALAAAA